MDLFSNQGRLDTEKPNQADLNQYLTPPWAANLLVDRYFANLTAGDYVFEPTCGEGAFLSCIEAHVPALGVELDPILADRARRYTGRDVVVADCLEFEPPKPVTAMIGNIPFNTGFLDSLLNKAREYLVDGARVGLILSAHQLQTSANVARWSKDYSIESAMLPRDIYPRLSKPIVFAIFTRDRLEQFAGMAIFIEAAEINALNKDIKRLFTEQGPGGVWARVVEAALIAFGGEASLQEIYKYVEPRRPTNNQFWREKIRQVARQKAAPVQSGVYRHPMAAEGL